ncbi:BOLA class I histocompatibility antigen, alpha chain BL3-7-like isoform X1 [Anolis sagrei]|uniref:BOLA class I histocompatibility antigen, alpha chain BL3-7-like isoform X1 n=1 Tax=Anolis sagrei TaxID=38937 RepID=UPI00351FF141
MGLSQRAPFFLLFGVAALLLGGSTGSSSHSLRYFYTSVSEPGQQVPQFFIVGYVDEQEYVFYDAKAKRFVPTVPWIRKVEEYDPTYWEWNNQIAQNAEQVLQKGLGTLDRCYNQSGGTHTLQKMYGCELRKDGSKGGYWQDGYDGMDYLSFDKETLTWTAADTAAQITKRKWEAEQVMAQKWKLYLEETCFEWLQRYLEYGKETLLRTEVPDVKVTRKAEYDGMETLICHVGGFYPKEIDIFWKRDGEIWMQDNYHGLVSPNLDGTYYTWRSVTVDPKERERYKCHVEHDGLLNPVDVAWEEHASKLWLIIGCVVGVFILIASLAGIAVCFTSNQGSNSSGTGTAVPI